MVGLLGCQHTLLGHAELLIHQYPQGLLLRAALYPFSSQPGFLLGISLTHVQDLALGLALSGRRKNTDPSLLYYNLLK